MGGLRKDYQLGGKSSSEGRWCLFEVELFLVSTSASLSSVISRKFRGCRWWWRCASSAETLLERYEGKGTRRNKSMELM